MFVRMLSSYILLSILPVIISGVFIYKLTSDFTIEDTYGNYKKSLEQMVFNTDQHMMGIYNIARILAEDTTVRSYKDFDVQKSNYSTDFINFLNNLQLYKSAYQTIDSIYLYYHDRVITTENGMRSVDNFDDGQWCKKIVAKARESNRYLLPYVTELRKRFNNNNENKYDYYDIISVISPMGGKYYENGMVVVNMREKSFRDNLDKLKQNDYDQIFILDKKSRTIISKSNKSGEFDDITGEDLMGFVSEEKVPQSVMFKDQKLMMATVHSSVTNWEYIAVSDYNRITERVVFIRNSIAVCVFLLIMIGFAAAVVIVGKIYAPIRNMVSNILNLQVKPGADEVSSIREYIQEILTTSDHNKHLLSKSLPSMKENIFLNLIRERMVDEADLAEKLRLCGVELQHKNYMTVVIAIDTYSRLMEKYSMNERLNFKYYILEVIGEKLNELAFAYGMETDQDKICFIINAKEGLEVQIIKKLFAETKKYIYINTDITFTVGIGKIYSSLEGVRYSYTEAMEALKERFTLGEDAIIYIEDVENRKGSFYTHIKVEEELLNYIYAGNEEKISQIIQNVLEDAASKGLKGEKVRQILLEVISFVGRRLFMSGMTYEDIFRGESNLLGDLEKCETLIQLETYIRKILIMVSRYVKSEEKSDDNTVIVRVKEYINKHYPEDLSLTRVAEIVKLSPSYLSTIFYKETNYNFLEYLNLVRINKAKELLLDSHLSIKDVSNKVGYLNYNTFSKVFKKYTGISAKQYRNEKGIGVDEEE